MTDSTHAPAAPSSVTHPEHTCERCGFANVVWFAPNDLWNRIVPEGGILCPVCFVQLAEAAGVVTTGWALVPEERLNAPSSPPESEESIESTAETDRCRTIAFAVNDGPLNVQPVSVNQVRHVLRCAARLAAESAAIHHTRPTPAGAGDTPDAWLVEVSTPGDDYGVLAEVYLDETQARLVAQQERKQYPHHVIAVVPLYRRRAIIAELTAHATAQEPDVRPVTVAAWQSSHREIL